MLWLELALRSAWARRTALAMAITSVAVSVFILLGVQQLRDDTRNSFSNALSGVDLVVGPRGSASELILYSVFQIGQPTRNMPYSTIEKLTQLPSVAWTIPIQLGDSYDGHPVIGTSTQLFLHYRANRLPLEFDKGVPFTDPKTLVRAPINENSQVAVDEVTQVVIGSNVAKRKRKNLGDGLILTHGKEAGLNTEHSDFTFKIVGILKPTGTPLDNAVLTSLEGFSAIHQDWTMGVKMPTGDKQVKSKTADFLALQPHEITASWVGLKSRTQVFSSRRIIESLPGGLMAVLPGVVLDDLWRIVSIVENALLLIGGMVAISALLGVASVLLVSLSARRRELAIYRALGAPPLALLGFIGIESLGVCLAGIIIGLALTQLLLFTLAPWVQTNFGIELLTGLPTGETWASLGFICLAAMIVSILPAWRAYRMSLADGLQPPVAG
jgi:putative ABC transport system permease protein